MFSSGLRTCCVDSREPLWSVHSQLSPVAVSKGQEEPRFLGALLCPQRYRCSTSHTLINQCRSHQTEGRSGGELLRLAPGRGDRTTWDQRFPSGCLTPLFLPLMPIATLWRREVTFRKVRKQPGGLLGGKLFVSQQESYNEAGFFQAPKVGSLKR